MPDYPPPTQTRRAFWVALAAAVTAAAAGAMAFLRPRGVAHPIDAGDASEYAVGTVRYLADQPGGRSSGLYVVRRPDGFVAYAALCTHQGVEPCRLAWRPERELFCPCHGGSWRQDSGEPADGPVPGSGIYIPHHVPALPLVSLPVRVTGGRALVITRTRPDSAASNP